MPTKTKEKAPRLEVADDATLADMTEAVTEYLNALYGDESTEDLAKRVAGLRRDLAEVEEDLSTSQAGLEDALQKDMNALDTEAAKDPNVSVEAKHYNEEKQRLARQVVKRERLRKLLVETQAAYGFRVAEEKRARAKELYEEIEPLRAELQEKEQKVNALQGQYTEATHTARETMPSKHDIANIVAVQKPDLSQLRQYLSYQ